MVEGKHRSGFTIVELVVAVGITVILVALSVPRYNAYVLRQEFQDNGQNLVTCMTEAQTAAVDPVRIFGTDAAGVTVHFTGVTITHTGADDTVTCEVFAYDKNKQPIASLNPTVTGKSWTAQRMLVDPTMVTDIDPTLEEIPFVSPVQIFYSGVRFGLPILLRVGGVDQIGPPDLVSQDGMVVNMTLTSTKASQVKGVLQMERLGVPVHFTQNEE